MKFVTIYASVQTCIIRDKNQTTVEFRPQNYRRFLRAIKSQKKSPYRVHFSGMKPFQTGPGTPEHLPGKLGAGPFNPPNRGICRDLLIKRHRSGFLSTYPLQKSPHDPELHQKIKSNFDHLVKCCIYNDITTAILVIQHKVSNSFWNEFTTDAPNVPALGTLTSCNRCFN